MHPFLSTKVAFFFIIIVSGLLLSAPFKAAAQETSIDATVETLEIETQDFTLPEDGQFTIVLKEPAADTSNAVIDVTIYSTAETNGDTEKPIHRVRQTIKEAETQSGDLAITLPIKTASSTQDGLLLPAPGPYRLAIALLSAETVLASTQTHLIKPDEEAAKELLVYLLLDADTKITSELLARHPNLTATFGITETYAEELRANPNDAKNLFAAIGDRPVFAAQTNPLDIEALAHVGQESFYPTLLQTYRNNLDTLGAKEISPTAVIATPFSNETINKTTQISKLEHILVSHADFESQNIAGVAALAANTEPVELFTSTPNPYQATSELLAYVAEQPKDEPTALLLTQETPTRHIETFFEAISTNNWVLSDRLTAMDLRQEVNEVAVSNDRLEPVAGELKDVIQQIQEFETFYSSEGTSPLDYKNQLTEALTQPSIEKTATALTKLNQEIDAEWGNVTLPINQSLTITSPQATIPITLTNNSQGTKKVDLTFKSDKVALKEQTKSIAIPPGVSLVDVDVDMKSLGVSFVEVQAQTPSGKILATSNFRLRSTAIPGLGLGLSVAAMFLLALWWRLHHKKHAAINKPS